MTAIGIAEGIIMNDYRVPTLFSSLFLLALLPAQPVWAQTEVSKKNGQAFAKFTEALPKTIQGKPLKFSQLPKGLPGVVVELKLEYGQVVQRADFPTILLALSAGGKICTASLVGPRTALLAAHCITHFGTNRISFNIEIEGKTKDVLGGCMIPNKFHVKREDWALCFLDQSVGGASFSYETVSPTKPPLNEPLILSGFGCSENNKPPDGKLRIGIAKVNKFHPNGVVVITKGDGSASSNAAVCGGDSGGPAFLFVSDAKGSRSIVAVNSVDLKGEISLLALLASNEGKSFLEEYRAKTCHKGICAKICGVNKHDSNCR